MAPLSSFSGNYTLIYRYSRTVYRVEKKNVRNMITVKIMYLNCVCIPNYRSKNNYRYQEFIYYKLLLKARSEYIQCVV